MLLAIRSAQADRKPDVAGRRAIQGNCIGGEMSEKDGANQAGAGSAGEPEEQFDVVERGSADELLDAGAHSELDAMRHSTAHVMAEAVLGLFPDAQLGIGPAIADGFYYDFLLPRPLTPDDLAAIENGMRASISADHPFVRREFTFADGRAFFAGRNQPFKVEILDDLASRSRETGSRSRPPRPTSTARSS